MFAIPGLNSFVEGVNAGRNRQLKLLTSALQLLDQGLEREARQVQLAQRAAFEKAVIDQTTETGSLSQALVNISADTDNPTFQTQALTALTQLNTDLVPLAQRQAVQGNFQGQAFLDVAGQGGDATPRSALQALSFTDPNIGLQNALTSQDRFNRITGQALAQGNSRLDFSRLNGLNASAQAQQQDAAGFGVPARTPTQQLGARVNRALSPTDTTNADFFGVGSDFFSGAF